MTSQIATNMSAVRAHSTFEKNNAQMSKAMDRATTGLRINSAQDNAANYAISQRMRERLNSLNQAQQNIQNDNAMMKTAEGAISNTVDLLRTARARVYQGLDSSANSNDQLAIAKELTQIFNQINDNAMNTKYNGKVLLTQRSTAAVDTNGADVAIGSDSSEPPSTLLFQVGDDKDAIISNVTLQNMTVKGLDLETNGHALVSTITDGAGALAFFDRISDNTGSGVTLLDDLDTALTTALNAAADVGAWEQRLGYTADNVSTQIENLENSDMNISNSDMAKEISNYMKFSVLSQASQYMLAQSNQNAFSVLNLLQ